MTPLAHMIAEDSTRRVKDRRYSAAAHSLLDGAHFFDAAAVWPMIWDLANSGWRRLAQRSKRLAFLPAPRTWIETCDPTSLATKRCAWLLEQDGDDFATLRMIYLDRDGVTVEMTEGAIYRVPLAGADWGEGEYSVLKGAWRDRPEDWLTNINVALVYALLAIINTPRVIGRRTHMPHAGLQRKMAAARGMVGKFPLRAWTEIVLDVTPPDQDLAKEREVRLSGGKALHFVRAHLRLWNGTLILVSAHWRGDAALGLCQSRYRLAA